MSSVFSSDDLPTSPEGSWESGPVFPFSRHSSVSGLLLSPVFAGVELVECPAPATEGVDFTEIFLERTKNQTRFKKENIQMVGTYLASFLGLLIKVIDGLKKFSKGQEMGLDLDPHVGDTACQLRAAMLFQLLNSPEFLAWSHKFAISPNKEERMKKKCELKEQIGTYHARVLTQYFLKNRLGYQKHRLLEQYERKSITWRDLLEQAKQRGLNKGKFASLLLAIEGYHANKASSLKEESLFSQYKISLEELKTSIPLKNDRVNGMPAIKISQQFTSFQACMDFFLAETPLKILRPELIFLAFCYGLSDPSAPEQMELSEKFLKKRLMLNSPKTRAQEMQIMLSRLSFEWLLSYANSPLSLALQYFKSEDECHRSLVPIYFASQVLTAVLTEIHPAIELRLSEKRGDKFLEVSRIYQFNFAMGAYAVATEKIPLRIVLCLTKAKSLDSTNASLERYCDALMRQGIFNFLNLSAAVHPQAYKRDKLDGEQFQSKLLESPEPVREAFCLKFKEDCDTGEPYTIIRQAPFLRHAYCSTAAPS